MPTSLTKDEALAYIDSRPTWIVLTTIGADGMPHTVPIGHFRIGDDIYLGGRAGTQKMLNAQRNPNVSLLMQSGTTMQNIKGVMVQGTATVFDSPEDNLRLSREAMRARGAPEDQLPREPRPGAAYIRVEPKRFISWDYASDG